MNQRRLHTLIKLIALAGAALLLPLSLHSQTAAPPTITSYQSQSIPQTNPTTGTQPPPFAINFVGTGFLSTTTANFTWTGGSGAGSVHFISATSVLVTLPTTIPATVTTITPSLCNGTSCATATPIPLTALSASTGTLTAAPNPVNVLQSVALSSTFAPVPSATGLPVTGAPSGIVNFTSGTTAIGTGKLILDPVKSSFIANNTAALSSQPGGPIYTADINGDGIPDVVFYDNGFPKHIHILLGKTPYGSFQTEILYALPATCLFNGDLAVGDLNKDGLADIVIDCADDTGNVYLYALLSNGDGTFAPPLSLTGVYGSSIALADMNNDGKLDLVVQGPLTPYSCNYSTPPTCTFGFAVFTGNGNGTFTASNQFITTVTGYTGLLLADIDHNGYPDIVALNNSGMGVNSIDIFLSHSGTSFGVVSGTTSAPSTSVALQPYPAFYGSLFSADFNGDGLPDLGVALNGGSTTGISTMLNTSTTGSASFGAISTVSTSPSSPNSVAAADLNGDGFPDLIVGTGINPLFYENDGKGNFANTYTNLSLPAGSVTGLTPADLNGDGDADLLVLNIGYTSGTSTLTSYITSGSADASLTFAPAQAGTPTLTATWPGNIDFTGSSATFTLTVNGSATLVSLTSNLATTQYGQPITLSATVSSTQPGIPTGTISFQEGDIPFATAALTGGTASFTTSALKVGKHFLNAIYSGDSVFSAAGSAAITITVNQAQPVVSWTPAPASITYGTALVAGQLNATASTPYITTVPGIFKYTPASGTVLSVGSQALNVTFTPTDTIDFLTASGSAKVTVSQATPSITWTAPTPIVVGTPLSTTQLDATASGPLGTVAGAFTYTPAAGTLLSAGASQTLTVLFAPTDTTDYTTATTTTTLTVIPVAITSLSPSTVTLGAAATPIIVTGTGFLPNSIININGTAAPTTYISPTSLSTTIPAASLQTPQVLKLTVTDPTQSQTSPAATFTVLALVPSATFTGPSTTQPGEQPTLSFNLNSNYPIAITGTLTLTFTGVGGVDDPAIQFSTGGRTFTFTVAANSTTTPTIQLQSGTDAGTITVTLVLTAAGQNITPSTIVPLTITIPATAPVVTSMTLTRSSNLLTANIMGYSDTRELSQATFHFTAASGSTINTPDITIPATTLFSTWFGNTTSQQYGSSFLYTQTFNLSSDQSAIGSVTVTLTNSIGASTTLTAQ